MKKSIKIAGIIILVLNLAGMVFLFTNQKKTGFIDYNTVYNNCKLKLSLEKDLQLVTTKRKSQLDSMQLQLSFLSQEVSSGKAPADRLNEFENQKNKFLTIQQQYEQENIRLKETYFNQIRKEINDKSKAFASARGYDYFFAAVGDGALMYGSDGEDVTKEFQQFVDQQ